MNIHQTKRKESNEKIISAAIKCFAENGYTNTSIAKIAKCAGVSVGLMTNRFNKESLLIAAYQEAVSRAYRKRKGYISLIEMFIDIIEQTKLAYDENREAFDFILMLLNSRDIPDSFYDIYKKNLVNEIYYPLVCSAQEQGIIPKGDIFPFQRTFIMYVMNHVDSCRRFGVEMLDSQKILDAVHIVDPVKREMENQREALYRTMCNTYTALTKINIVSDFAEHMRAPDFLVPYANTDKAQETINNLLIKYIHEDYRQELCEFFDMKTINSRIGDKNAITCMGVSTGGRKQIYTIAPHRRNENGDIIEVLIGFSEFD